jgi:hypothetical protein
MEWALKRSPEIIDGLLVIPLGGSPLSGALVVST